MQPTCYSADRLFIRRLNEDVPESLSPSRLDTIRYSGRDRYVVGLIEAAMSMTLCRNELARPTRRG